MTGVNALVATQFARLARATARATCPLHPGKTSYSSHDGKRAICTHDDCLWEYWPAQRLRELLTEFLVLVREPDELDLDGFRADWHFDGLEAGQRGEVMLWFGQPEDGSPIWTLATMDWRDGKVANGLDEIRDLLADPAFRAEYQLEKAPVEAVKIGLGYAITGKEDAKFTEELRAWAARNVELVERQHAELLFHGTPGLRDYGMLSEIDEDVAARRDAVIAGLKALGWPEPTISYEVRWGGPIGGDYPEVRFDPDSQQITYEAVDDKESGSIYFDVDIPVERIVAAIDRLRWVLDAERAVDDPILSATRDVARSR